MAIQMRSRSHVSTGSAIICANEKSIPKIGTQGTKGVLKGLGKSGCVRRKTITLALTIAKASRVPIETSAPSISMGKRPETNIAIVPVKIVVT